ncbi:MAG: hypothetical protein J5I94_19500 [Phaeodactylibacter sp.]|nr:hypothetical protein [Phaeodactylibacter sp.]
MRTSLFYTLFIIAALYGCQGASSEQDGAPQQETKSKAPYPAAIDSLIDKYYRSVSGQGEMDWAPLREICLESTQFNAMGINEEGENQYYPTTLESYIEHLGPFVEEYGFYQKEIFRSVNHYNRIAQVWSVFESYYEPGGEQIDRGIYSFQLVQLGGEWKAVNVLWNSETEEVKVPEAYWK